LPSSLKTAALPFSGCLRRLFYQAFRQLKLPTFDAQAA